MHVLHVNSGVDPRQGGPTTAMHAMLHAQIDVGMKVSVAATFGHDFQPGAADLMKQVGADVHLIGPCSEFLARHPDIKRMLQDLIPQVDIVHIHATWEEIQHQTARIARKLGKPYVFTPHGMLDPWSLSQNRLLKRAYFELRLRRDLNRAAAIHFTTETERKLVAPLGLTAPTLVEPLIIDLSDFQPPTPLGQLRVRFQAQLCDRPFALFMSRIHHKKGLDLLIPAFARMSAKDAMLVIAGPDVDGYRAAVEQMARESGIADRVLFPGMLYGRDRAAALVDAEVFVLPSYQENFGVVVIEALAAGTPVIISDQVNIQDTIAAAQVGEVVPTSVQPLSDALSRWLNDRSLRESASHRAIEFVAQTFDRHAQAQRWMEHYQRFIAAAR